MAYKLAVAALMSTLTLTACGGGGESQALSSNASSSSTTDIFAKDCTAEINNKIAEIGDPETIDKYDSGNYHSHSYKWFNGDYTLDFTWGDIVQGCEIKTFWYPDDFNWTPTSGECPKKIKAELAARGESEKVFVYWSPSTSTYKYYWYAQGVIYTFDEGEFYNGCEVSTSTFAPF
ncbi:hypothetical protein K6Y31_06325 [Motilimonas cestriensis]|uniref:Lipoprotein n=1 Tax=Motilimonas cestriensis TaxID=2742685 RepID=A0ABS8W9J4_9GAMM|nr:hypothetical protein [Motilimonas cestriensis]MCE2594426.1 hypothetical protein [Motilimonas cestriensis]